MSRVILKYRNIAQGKMKSIYLEFNPAFHDIKGNCVRYECLNLEIYTTPGNSQLFKHNRSVEEIAETIRCERYLQLVRHDYSFLAKARLDEDFLEYFRMNGDCHGAKYKAVGFILRGSVKVNASSGTSMRAYANGSVFTCFVPRGCSTPRKSYPRTLQVHISMHSLALSILLIEIIFFLKTTQHAWKR